VLEFTPTRLSGRKADFPSAIEWAALGLPEDYLPLLASWRSAFVASGKRIVGHGGISLEEFLQLKPKGVSKNS